MMDEDNIIPIIWVGLFFVIQLIQDFSLLLLYKNVLKILKGLNSYKNPPFKQKVLGTHQILSGERPSYYPF